jgi:G3E family GTPase
MTHRPIPIHVVTGFLGAGKSTLLNALLRRPELADTAVIVNEFGAVGIDHHLIQSAIDRTVLLESGCLCCTLRGDLIDTLAYLRDQVEAGAVPAFERVIVETTGLADPAPIMRTLIADEQLTRSFVLGNVLATVDAVVGDSTLEAFVEAREQVALADRILITKADLTSSEGAGQIEEAVRRLNPRAPIDRVEHGEIAPERILAAPGVIAPEPSARIADHGEGHAHTPGLVSAAVTFERPLPWQALRAWLASITSLRGRDILRIKGLVDVAGCDGPVVIHGVQHTFHPPTRLPAWPDDDRRTRIVLVTRRIPAIALQRSLEAFVDEDAARRAPG